MLCEIIWRSISRIRDLIDVFGLPHPSKVFIKDFV